MGINCSAQALLTRAVQSVLDISVEEQLESRSFHRLQFVYNIKNGEYKPGAKFENRTLVSARTHVVPARDR